MPPGFKWADDELYVANYKVLTLLRTGSVTTLLFSAGGTMLMGGAGILTARAIKSGKKRKASGRIQADHTPPQ